MKYIANNLLLFLLVCSSGCVAYPRYYTTGKLTGIVLDIDSQLPVSNALVIAELRIRDYDAMSGESSKRVASGYAITDSEGTFQIPSMSTLYIYFAAIMRERKANGYVVRPYHPMYTCVNRTNDVSGGSIWNMRPGKNTAGLDQIMPYFKGWHSVSIRRADRKTFQTIIQDLYQNDGNPNKDEQRLHRKLK